MGENLPSSTVRSARALPATTVDCTGPGSLTVRFAGELDADGVPGPAAGFGPLPSAAEPGLAPTLRALRWTCTDPTGSLPDALRAVTETAATYLPRVEGAGVLLVAGAIALSADRVGADQWPAAGLAAAGES